MGQEKETQTHKTVLSRGGRPRSNHSHFGGKRSPGSTHTSSDHVRILPMDNFASNCWFNSVNQLIVTLPVPHLQSIFRQNINTSQCRIFDNDHQDRKLVDSIHTLFSLVHTNKTVVQLEKQTYCTTSFCSFKSYQKPITSNWVNVQMLKISDQTSTNIQVCTFTR